MKPYDFCCVERSLAELLGCETVLQEELQRLRDESSDAVVERDRLKEEISSLENNCGEKSGEIERLNKQLEAISVELKVNEHVFSKLQLIHVAERIIYDYAGAGAYCFHTLCPIKTCDYILYNNFNNKCPITIIFCIVNSPSRRHRKMVSFPTSPI